MKAIKLDKYQSNFDFDFNDFKTRMVVKVFHI